MMEHVDAVAQIDSILALPGLDGVMIGPGDLSGSLGTLLDMSNPRFRPHRGNDHLEDTGQR